MYSQDFNSIHLQNKIKMTANPYVNTVYISKNMCHEKVCIIYTQYKLYVQYSVDAHVCNVNKSAICVSICVLCSV